MIVADYPASLCIARQGAAGNKGQRLDHERRGGRESRAVPAPDANAELVASMQVTPLKFVSTSIYS